MFWVPMYIARRLNNQQ